MVSNPRSTSLEGRTLYYYTTDAVAKDLNICDLLLVKFSVIYFMYVSVLSLQYVIGMIQNTQVVLSLARVLNFRECV